jgi:hypothetical protein
MQLGGNMDESENRQHNHAPRIGFCPAASAELPVSEEIFVDQLHQSDPVGLYRMIRSSTGAK